MSYRIAFAPVAEEALGKLPSPNRFKTALARTLGADPYGHGSTPVGGDQDRREAVVSQVIVRYVISTGILTITVVRLIPEP
ncbi:type II toxin-antitoxin system RelE/ParE family toxin [Streptomyces sp. NPDC056909]|uniref:type II toxin-antitoxin system RelE family toxin n=1 Tax=Streptomyces sp. NPDC056909 TaxID=3345963 RepID=UPI0036BEB6E4